jgi:hypothetical protein
VIEFEQVRPDIQPQNEKPVARRVLLRPVMVPAPISRDPEDWRETTPPEDLRELVRQVRGVRRFSENPQIAVLVPDNTAAHLQRSAFIILNMRLPEVVDRGRSLRMTWVSDLPEKGLKTDASVVTRTSDPLLARRIEERELAVAQRMFAESPEDMALYLMFLESGRFFRGQEADLNYVTPDGMLANAVDSIEANTYFFHWVTQEPDLIPSLLRRYVDYVMEQVYRVSDSIFKGEVIVDVALVRCLNQIFLDQLRFIMECWSRVPFERIPAAYELFTKRMIVSSPNAVCQFP